ncbi:MAG: hypothetical protein WCO60_09665 [Verrucomicrobiota bacterium]
MIRLLLVATIVLSMISALFAYKTRTRGEQCVEERESFENKAKMSEVQLGKERKEKKEIEVKAQKLEKEGNESKDQAERAKTELAKLQEDATKLLTSFKDKETEIIHLKEEMAKQKADEPKVNMAEIDSKMADLRAQLEKSQQVAQENEKKAEALARQIEGASKKKEQEIQKVVAAKKLAIKNAVGQIVAYNEGWNFVVVNLGDKQGVTPDSQLEVKRDGKVLAKLRVSQVQPTQTTAGIVQDSKGKTVKIMPGDTVMFAANPTAGSAGLALDTAKVP